MKHNIKTLIGFTISTADGDIGTAKDFYFEDDSWAVRYLVVATGSWLNRRKVLISAEALITMDFDSKAFLTNLTKEQVKNSPDIDTELPVYRQQEVKLYDHYLLGNYWRAGFVSGGMPLPFDELMIKEDEEISARKTDDDPHLRSIEKVLGYAVQATNGYAGSVKDFIIEEVTWKISLMVVDTNNWLPGKNVLVSTKTVKNIRWDFSEVLLDIDQDDVKNSAEYDKSELWAL